MECLTDASLIFEPEFLTVDGADDLLDTLLRETPWRQEHIKLFGRRIPLPRLTAWYADAGLKYRYSGIACETLALTPALSSVRKQLEQRFAVRLNSVLLNLYRHGSDCVGWHADNEKELGARPSIVSLSVGATRHFNLRHINDRALRYSLALTHGSALLMAGTTQQYWQHRIPKTKKPSGVRVNLTFRFVYP